MRHLLLLLLSALCFFQHGGCLRETRIDETPCFRYWTLDKDEGKCISPYFAKLTYFQIKRHCNQLGVVLAAAVNENHIQTINQRNDTDVTEYWVRNSKKIATDSGKKQVCKYMSTAYGLKEDVCMNGNSRGGFCSYSALDRCLNATCEQICVIHEETRHCECYPGYQLHKNGYTCLDIDECSQANKCDQQCHNMKGSYNCSCHEGFVKSGDDMCLGTASASTASASNTTKTSSRALSVDRRTTIVTILFITIPLVCIIVFTVLIIRLKKLIINAQRTLSLVEDSKVNEEDVNTFEFEEDAKLEDIRIQTWKYETSV